MSKKQVLPAPKNLKRLLPNLLILAGIAILVLVLFFAKNQASKPAIPADESPEAQLDRYLAEGKPTFVFFHSNTCQSCIDMIAVVNQVYPEYQERVGLVDVNVYDAANQNLLQRARINSIPTQLFMDATGQGNLVIGVMAPEQLAQQLQTIAEEK